MTTVQSEPSQKPTDAQSFHVVGIGCSAGGLEAVEQFLSHLPPNSGLAIVIVQHMAPTHVSALPEILQHVTRMPVIEGQDGMTVRPNSVYVIPPNKDMSLLRGKLHMHELSYSRGVHLPIDLFLRSLAEDCGKHAIGIILSGMGSDGVFGLRAIRENAGLTLVQLPSTAEAQGMPLSAIGAGLADIVAAPEAMPDRILLCINHPPRNQAAASGDWAASPNALETILLALRERTGNDFSHYKTSTVLRRIERRASVNHLAHLEAYAAYVRGNPHEVDILLKELLIGVTSFFRDPSVWETMQKEVLPTLLMQYPKGHTFRAWVPACSRGEEAYTLAMVFKEALAQLKAEGAYSLQIFATDLDLDAIAVARQGHYPENISTEVPPALLERYFRPQVNGGYVVRREIRDMVVYAQHNIISDTPFTRLDVISCRNLLIYFNATLQTRLIPLLHYALNPGGVLLLGTAETVGNYSELFAPFSKESRIFRKVARSRAMEVLEFPGKKSIISSPMRSSTLTKKSANIGEYFERFIQQNWAPAAVLVNGDGDILYICGRTGKYLEPAAGQVNMNIYAMAREGLREGLIGAIQAALVDTNPVRLNGLRVGTNGGTQIVDVLLQTIGTSEALQGRVAVIFQDVPAPRFRRRSGKGVQPDPEKEELLQSLMQTREALRATQEEMQTAVEELKSSNEELQSTNEELQSTNEELTTSKEELQSLNEELLTVNTELESKVSDLTWVRNDMTNLLNSTEIATLFLDAELKLRRFTSHSTRIFRLIPGDIGRLLSDVVTDLDYPQLQADADEVLRTLVFKEHTVPTRDNRWYRVRIMPYRTAENVIDGVVLTFIDMTQVKKLEADLQQNRSQ